MIRKKRRPPEEALLLCGMMGNSIIDDYFATPAILSAISISSRSD